MTIIAKDMAKQIIDALPDDSSYDEILKELAERGLEDSKFNRTISNEEMKQKIAQWQK